MSEVDYQMALLLQYKFEQEHKHKPNTDSDQQLALELQQQFQAEAETEHPSNNLVYKAPALNTSKCLVDPSWEVIDPTPDVHVLFMAFNQKFFWNTLGSVTVAWSKKMTTCAGICSYQGRGGMCSITLSEPLLKLRPRKDLVETLLHEMIHAYLFVTNNNRDRDGHGPEFHKHMYRINAEAGTNITVFHDFHDEVKLYQQHWWRCNGPCQSQKPFFGILRRATNRAPGPNDRWWAEHTRNCGGMFIKVKSPEKPEKPQPKTSNKKSGNPTKLPDPKNDIRNYISITSNASTPKAKDSNKENKTLPNIIPINSTSLPKLKTTSSVNNIKTISNSSNSTPQVTNVIPSKTSHIFGFTNLNVNNSGTPKIPSSGTKGTPKKPSSTSGIRGTVKNAGSSTFVVTKKGGCQTLTNTNEGASTSASNIEVFGGTGKTLNSGITSSLSNTGDYLKVREHWLKKFENSSGNGISQNGIKRSSTNNMSSSAQKIPKLLGTECSGNDDRDKVECPVCKKKFRTKELNRHLDTCLESPKTDTKKCFICSSNVPTLNFEKHVAECSDEHFKDDFDEDSNVSFNLIRCPSCLKEFDQKSHVKHKEHCGESNVIDLTNLDSDTNVKNCPACNEALPPSKYDVHLEKCVLKMCDQFEKKYEPSKDSKTSCLACNEEILKSELNSHLEECMSITNVLEASSVSIEDIDTDEDDVDKSVVDNVDSKSYNCPFCLKMILEKEMQSHLDICLNIEDCTEESVKEKSLLVDCLCSTDFDLA